MFLASRTPVLVARDVKTFLPCTVNLDPKLREIIAGGCPRNVSFPSRKPSNSPHFSSSVSSSCAVKPRNAEPRVRGRTGPGVGSWAAGGKGCWLAPPSPLLALEPFPSTSGPRGCVPGLSSLPSPVPGGSHGRARSFRPEPGDWHRGSDRKVWG